MLCWRTGRTRPLRAAEVGRADGRYYVLQASQRVPNTLTVVISLWALRASAQGTDGNTQGLVQLTSGPMSFGNASLAQDSQKMWAIGVQPAAEVVKYAPGSKKFVPVIPGVSATDLGLFARR